MSESPSALNASLQPSTTIGWSGWQSMGLAELLFRQSDEAQLLVDLVAEQVMDANEEFCRLTDFPRQDLLAAPLRSLIRHEQDWQDWLHRLGDKRERSPGYLLRGRSNWLPVAVRLLPLDSIQADSVALLSIQDRQDEQQWTLRWQRSEAELRRLIGGISDCVWSCRLDPQSGWIYRYLSPGVNRLTGRSVGQFLDQPSLWESCIHKDDVASWQAFRQRLQSGQSGSLEYRLRREDGTELKVQETALVLFDESGPILQGIITELPSAPPLQPTPPQPAMFPAGDSLEMVSRFANRLAHDLNNLITGILGHASLGQLVCPAQDPLQKELQQIEIIGLRVAEMCQQLQLCAGKPLGSGLCATPGYVLSQVVERFRSVFPHAQICLEVMNQESTILLSSERFSQLAEILIRNAVESLEGGPGEVLIRVKRVPVTEGIQADNRDCFSWLAADSSPNALLYCLEVQDTGKGIPPEIRPHIFEPYFSTRQGQRGLGLTLVQGIVRGNRGALRLKSKPGGGTTICCLLPCRSEPVSHPQLAANTTSGPARFNGTILLIDDDKAILDVIGRLLISQSWKVVPCQSGDDCLEYLQTHPGTVQAALLDWTLPGLGGESTLRQIRQQCPELPVLVMSGHAASELKDVLEELQVVGYLQKPFRFSVLTEALQHLLPSK